MSQTIQQWECVKTGGWFTHYKLTVLLLTWPIEIVDLFIKNGDISHIFVCLPEGKDLLDVFKTPLVSLLFCFGKVCFFAFVCLCWNLCSTSLTFCLIVFFFLIPLAALLVCFSAFLLFWKGFFFILLLSQDYHYSTTRTRTTRTTRN